MKSFGRELSHVDQPSMEDLWRQATESRAYIHVARPYNNVIDDRTDKL